MKRPGRLKNINKNYELYSLKLLFSKIREFSIIIFTMNDEQRLKFYVPEHLKAKPIIFEQEIGKVALCDSNEQN